MSTKTEKTAYDKLSPKMQRFVDEYLVDNNGAQAAIRAGYSEKTAREQAARLLTKVIVKKALEEKRAEIAEENQLKISDVIDELKKIAFSDVTQVMSFNSKNARVKSSKSLSEDAKKTISSVSKTQNGLTVKLHDKVKALELLGRYLNIFSEKIQVEGAGIGLILNMSPKNSDSRDDSRCVDVESVSRDDDIDADDIDDVDAYS